MTARRVEWLKFRKCRELLHVREPLLQMKIGSIGVVLGSKIGFCKRSAGFGSSNKTAIYLPFSSYRSILATLSLLRLSTSHSLAYLAETLSSFTIRLQRAPDLSFLSGNRTVEELARRNMLLQSSIV